MAAIQPLGEPDHRGEGAHRAAQRPGEVAVAIVRLLRRRLAMVAGDEGDDLDLLGIEAAKVAILDQVVRVTMMALVADMDADVMQECAVFEPLALAVGQSVHAARLVEDGEREARHLLGVLRPVAAALAEFDDAAATDIRVALDLLDPRAVAVDVVEHQPFAQGQVAERQLAGAEPAQDGVEQHRAGDAQVGPARIEAGHREPRVDGSGDERLAQPVQRLGADPAVAQIAGRGASFGGRHRAQTEDGAGGADDPVEATGGELIEVVAHLLLQVLHQAALVPARERVALHEPLGQPDDAGLETPAHRQLRRRAEGDLDAAAPDVEDHGGRAADIDAVARGQVDQPCLFCAADHSDADTRLSLARGNKVAAVISFPGGAGGGCHNLVHLMRLGNALELGEGLKCRRHGGRRQAPAVEPASPETDHILFSVNDFEGQVGPDLDHDHVNGIGADIDGGDAHQEGSSAGPGLACYIPVIYSRTQPIMNKPRQRVTTQLLQRRARELKRHLPGAVGGDDHAVHQARVATRRLREAVPVLSAGLKHSRSGKATRKIRRLTRALGSVRELDVTLHLLDEFARAGQLPRTAIEEVRAHVLAERDRHRTTMLERMEGVNTEKLGRRLESVAEALESSVDEPWRDVLAGRLLKRGRKLAKAADEAGHMYVPERLHAVRIAAKKLRYALELAADGGTPAAASQVRVIKRAQDLLGRLHDLQILQSHVAAVQTGLGANRPGMDTALAALARHIEDACRHLHGRYLASAGVLRAVCDAIPTEVVPPLQKPRARRALKMGLSRRRATAAGGRR